MLPNNLPNFIRGFSRSYLFLLVVVEPFNWTAFDISGEGIRCRNIFRVEFSAIESEVPEVMNNVVFVNRNDVTGLANKGFATIAVMLLAEFFRKSVDFFICSKRLVIADWNSLNIKTWCFIEKTRAQSVEPKSGKIFNFMSVHFNGIFVARWLWTLMGTAVVSSLQGFLGVFALMNIPALQKDLNALSNYNWDLLWHVGVTLAIMNTIPNLIAFLVKSPLNFDEVFQDVIETTKTTTVSEKVEKTETKDPQP